MNQSPRKNKVDLFTMVVLRRRLDVITTEMVNVLFRTGRSGVLNTGMDFSCSITDSKPQSISSELGLPIHVSAIHLIPESVLDKYGTDIHPGDCFVNNSSYHGNTHCGDVTFCAPVFYSGELCFFTIARAHFADIGFPTPTTYGPKCRDVYEEGLMLPCVRIQRSFRDVDEVVDICKANIRVPEQFYGDYLGALAAVRTGEKRLVQLCDKYGIARVKDFLDDFQAYAEDMAIAAIRKLPGGTVSKEIRYDSELEEYPDGIPVRARLTVDPVQAHIEVDLTDNVDNLPLGINLSEATALAACRTGVFNVLGPTVPRCAGSFKRVTVRMREGSCIGKPRFPAATSSATTNLCHALAPHVQSMFAQLSKQAGAAYGTIGMPGVGGAVVSGQDFRRNNQPFVNQLIIGYWGGPALYGHDGWLTYGHSSSQGALWQSSVEMLELQQPLLIETLALRLDSGGAGEWEGAPGAYCVFKPRGNPVRFTTNAASHVFPPPGVCGGLPGAPTNLYKIHSNGVRVELPMSLDVVINANEKLISEACGGGGYGEPLDRDPQLIRYKSREGWISPERVKDTYGVILDTSVEEYAVEAEATLKLRQALRESGRRSACE